MVPFDQEMMTTSWGGFCHENPGGAIPRRPSGGGPRPSLWPQKRRHAGAACEKMRRIGTGLRYHTQGGAGGHHRQLHLYPPSGGTGAAQPGKLVSGPSAHADRHCPPRPGHWVGRLFPTANLVIPPHVLVPSHGVYVTRATLEDGSCYAAVTNVGTRPTVNNGADITLEACLLDYEGDLYDKKLRVEFFEHLRQEIRFDSLDTLKAQIAADAASTRRYFQTHP